MKSCPFCYLPAPECMCEDDGDSQESEDAPVERTEIRQASAETWRRMPGE